MLTGAISDDLDWTGTKRAIKKLHIVADFVLPLLDLKVQLALKQILKMYKKVEPHIFI